MPRDIDKICDENICVFAVDDLQDIVNKNLALREEQAKIAYGIVGRHTQDFFAWLQTLNVEPLIKMIRQQAKEASLNEEKKYTPGPQVFSSVFVNNKEEKLQEKVVEEKVEEKPKNISLFTIADDDNLELPSLKKEEKKEGPNIDNITGETYNINR